MTKISYIHGIGSTAEERWQRGELIPERSAINFTAWTEGETRLALLAEQVNILAAYHPEIQDLQKAKSLLTDTLYKGLHRVSLPSGIVSGMLATVVKEIRNAREMTRPAAGSLIGRRNISAGISDPLIPLEDCQITEYEDPATGWTWQEEDNACKRRNAFKQILNTHLEKSSHHLLYEFVANPNIVPATVAVKTVNHKAAKSTINQITSLSKDNLRLWMRTGILRQNAKNGAGPLQPEETIQALKENPEGIEGINFLPVAAVVAIIQAIAVAVSAAAALVTAFKQKDSQSKALFNQLQGIGTDVWGPETGDWYTGKGQTDAQNIDIQKLLPFGLIAAGLLFTE